MTKVDKVRSFFNEHRYFCNMQTFNTRNIVGDRMVTIYNSEDVQIDYCPSWGYLEIFGLSNTEFLSLRDILDIS